MTSAAAPSLSACCSRGTVAWLSEGDASMHNGVRLYSGRSIWFAKSELAKPSRRSCVFRASAVANTTQVAVESPIQSDPSSVGEPKPRRRRQPKSVDAVSSEGALKKTEDSLAVEEVAEPKPKRRTKKGENLDAAAESTAETASLADGAPSIGPAKGKQAQKRRAAYVQDAKSLNVSTKRAVALLHLLRIENDAAYASLLDRTGQQVSLRVVEKALGLKIEPLSMPELRNVTELVSATTKWRQYLDYVIECVFAREGKKQRMKVMMKQLLRLGACEVLKLGQPSHVINELVQLTKYIKGGGGKAAKFVNYVLRQITEMKEAGTLPVPTVEGNVSKAEALGTIHSQPDWLVRRWLERYGEEKAVEFLQWNNAVPAFGVRPNSARGITVEGFKEKLDKLAKMSKKVDYVESPFLPTVLRVQNGLQNIRDMLDEGLCSIQDESAGLVVNLLDPTPGDFIVDTCAAPGGKTFHAAERLKGEGTILALDIHSARLQKLADMAKKMALDSVIQKQAGDLRYLARNRPQLADKVLVDAPCTGLGVIARRADLRWRKSQDNLDELVKLQSELLDAAVAFVKPGGLLVYSTCSVEPEENELQVEAFLERYPEFSVESATPYVPMQAVTARGFYATLPFRDGIDGAFGARLRRAAEV